MIERLACRLGRNDETPNIELAEYLCQQSDKDGIKEIVEGFKSDDKALLVQKLREFKGLLMDGGEEGLPPPIEGDLRA